MENTFYIPLNSSSLAHYFSKAIILPAKYFTNKPEDIQNKFAESILLSKIKWVEHTDCSIEVVLTKMEIKEMINISEKFLLLNTPIPISRVKSVCFLDQKQMETTIWNINNGAAFIPESLVSVEKNNDLEFLSFDDINPNSEVKERPELSDKIKSFDIILGGFAFMRLGGKSFMNYSENYFSTLSYFNKLIEEQTNTGVKEMGLKLSNKYWGLFSIKIESEWSNWQQYVSKNITVDEILSIAESKNLKAEKNYLGILKLDSINTDSHLYEFAILATYGDGKSKSTDNLVTDISNGTIKSEKIEDVSLLFGLNNGYSKLRNKYKGSLHESNVKFTLESKLDYYTIESIFQFAFHGTKSNYSFDYIDKWCSVSKKAENINAYESYKIIDINVIVKKKPTPLEFFLENCSADIYSSIVRSVKQWLPPFVKINEMEAMQFFEKELAKSLAISVESLQKKIKSDAVVYFNKQNHEIIESFEKEIEKLSLEIFDLKEENALLKKGFDSSSGADQKGEPNDKMDNLEIENIKESNISATNVQESTVEYNANYEAMNVSDLKRIAKDKKIKINSKNNKEELIKLIKQAPPTLL